MRIALIASLLLTPTLAFAAPQTFDELMDLFLTFISAATGIALIAGIVIYFYGVATSIPKMSTGDAERLRAHFVWGIIALFVMFSVWGILALLRNTLFGGSGGYGLDGGYDTEECATFDDCVIGEDFND